MPAAVEDGQVVIFNRPIVTYRATFLGITPQERARRTIRNLRDLLAQGGAGEVSVQTDHPEGQLILLDGKPEILITPGDVDPLGSASLEDTTAATVAALRQVIAETREARDLRTLTISTAQLAVVSLLVLLVFRLANWGRRFLAERLVSLTERFLGLLRHRGRLDAAGSALLRLERVVLFLRRLLDLLFYLVMLAVGLNWLSFALRSFPYTRPWGERLNAFFLDLLVQFGLVVAEAIPKLVVAALIFLIARGLVITLRALFDRVERGESSFGWLDRDTVVPTRRIATVVVWIFALVMAYPYLPGAHTDAFKGISVLLGLMISLGSTSVVGQAAAGLILMYTRSIRVGEYVGIGEYQGTILSLGFFTTRMRTDWGDELNLPNAMIVGMTIRNYSRPAGGQGYLLDTTVTIGYDTPWRQVEAMLLEAAARTPGVLAEPRPRVLQTGLSDFYPVYRLLCHTAAGEPRPRAELMSALLRNVQDVFNHYGVQIMSPSYRGDPARPKVVPPERWYAPPARPPADTPPARP
jgi:small-conductance mechanosensitive channel